MDEKESERGLAVFISMRESRCEECKEDLGSRAWITLNKAKGALCLSCADLDHLLFLAAGDPALTRRAKKHSGLSAVVLKWSRARKRYERQGLLVEEEALQKAEQECLSDADAREQRRSREAERRQELDRNYVERFAARVRELFPHCPPDRETQIAEHACRKYSGRVGRSEAAKALGQDAVRLAVMAHIRHAETSYDSLLNDGWDRWDARDTVAGKVHQIEKQWSEAKE